MKLLYPKEHFSCFNYEKGQNANLEILKRPFGATIDRDLVDTEIVFVMKGRIKLTYDKLSKEVISKGKIMLFPPGSHIISEIEEEAHLIICRVKDVVQLCSCMSLERLYNEVEPTPEGFHTLESNARIESFIKLFRQCVDDGLKCSFYFETKMKEFFLLLRAYYSKEELAGFFAPLLGKDAQFMNLMYKSYRNVSSVQELAALSNYSLSGFKKQFHRVFGTSASEWMSSQKAIRIFQDLNNSSLSIKEIAFKYGFSSASAFSSFCRKKFKLPPGKIKLNAKKIV